jgi:hypothetical protein
MLHHCLNKFGETEILHQCALGLNRVVGAGLFHLFASFFTIGEPAPTSLLIMVQAMNKKQKYCSPIDNHVGAGSPTNSNPTDR